MTQAQTSLARISCASYPSAVILVMPGRLCRQIDNREFGESSSSVIEGLDRMLNQFSGAICGIVVDSDILQLCLHPKLAASFCSLAYRAKSRIIVHADRIDERDRSCSSLAIAQQLIGRSGLDAGHDTIWLTGAGWDGTDQPTDLLGYAFRGLGFSTIMDPELRMPRRAA